ncbi:MAG: ATP-binding protein [bacterium]
MKEILKTVIRDWQKSFPRAGVLERTLKVPFTSQKIISVIGPRRAGKTFYLFHVINQLHAQVGSDRIIYLNFEDERLELVAAQLHLILEAYYELYPDNYGKEMYLFFDEIQEVRGWEKFVRRLYDSVTKNIFLTGSSAKMLGKEIATGLRGRNLTYNLFPLSFEEYCRFQGLDLTDLHSTQAKAVFRSRFEKYMLRGGFPETVFMDEELARKTLQSYFDVMLFRDIVDRHAVSNAAVLKQFLKRILNSVSNKLSVHKFYNELKSQGLAVSKNAIYEFLDHALDCFLLFTIHAYEPSPVKQQMKTRKVYAVDSGLVNAVTYRFSEDRGALLENAVFIHLSRNECALHYLNDQYECDFIVQENQAVTKALQVCLSLESEATREREIRGALRAAERFDLPEAYIITLDEEGEFEREGRTIMIRPCWKWLLSGK